MFKKLRNAIARRREIQLRQWCVNRAHQYTPEELYVFLTTGHLPEKSPQSAQES